MSKQMKGNSKGIRRKFGAKHFNLFGSFLTKDNKKIKNSFLIVASVFLVTYVLLFIFLNDVTSVTMSFICNNGHRFLFIFWGISTASLVGLILVRMYNTFGFKDKASRNLLRVAYISLVSCVLVPSLASIPRFISAIHDYSAVAYVVFSLLSLLFFIRYITRVNRSLGLKSFVMLLCMLFIPFTSLILFGHCGVYEIAFFVCLVLYLIGLNFFLQRHKDVLVVEEQRQLLLPEGEPVLLLTYSGADDQHSNTQV